MPRYRNLKGDMKVCPYCNGKVEWGGYDYDYEHPMPYGGESGEYKARQLLHIASELWEIVKAYIKGDVQEMKMESMDLIQSVYTLLHILGMTEREHEKMKWEMEVKNWERGYYKRGDISGVVANQTKAEFTSRSKGGNDET